MDDSQVLKKVRDDAEWLAYLLALEKERHDSSHVTNAQIVAEAKENLTRSQVRHVKALVDAEIEQLESMREQRDKLFFNAGRYAAGALDEVASASHRIMDALLDSEG
jgi:hypothetical protein